jgi:hypothetical protein
MGFGGGPTPATAQRCDLAAEPGAGLVYVHALLEFQSGVHPFMAARLSTYLDRLYQDLIRAGNSGAADAFRRCRPSSSMMDGDTGAPPPTWPI